ncbi:RpiB/LacA/LacB family sugar-phosphate isomerase [Blattabacterium cuenoti]|uniref:RpiB/LacA/LacB family sugar-phosphate isomerase n=1 Tax=Blattabacterium cuenoti TaxID=1653831 RepID=UPI00293BB6DC|nr:RpiB/LacA/LacB family sugar-phosphate isomerase [Blattabacterium cuenoti]
MIKIAIGSDHTGVYYKYLIKDFLRQKKYEIQDFGSFNYEEKVDYPDFIHPTANSVNNHSSHFGIILCGSGNGASMTANKYKNVRSSVVWNKQISSLARRHNNSNIISIPSRFVKTYELLEIVDIFLHTSFEGGRHQIRIEKI